MKTKVIATLPTGWRLVELYHGCGTLFATLWTKTSVPTTKARKATNICSACGQSAGGIQDFRDALSLREFEISGMCQDCQDAVFVDI
jgi:hypothetical protein